MAKSKSFDDDRPHHKATVIPVTLSVSRVCFAAGPAYRICRRGIEADESMYADDADFLVHDDAAVSQIIEIVPTVLADHFNLCLNG
jgi:hypothetical protein